MFKIDYLSQFFFAEPAYNKQLVVRLVEWRKQRANSQNNLAISQSAGGSGNGTDLF